MGALLVHPIDDEMALTSFFEQGRHGLRRLLEVFVDRNNPLSTGIGDAAQRGGVLAKILAEADSSRLTMLLSQRADRGPVFSAPTIIYKNDLEFIASCVKCELQTTEKFCNRASATIDRNDDTDIWRSSSEFIGGHDRFARSSWNEILTGFHPQNTQRPPFKERRALREPVTAQLPAPAGSQTDPPPGRYRQSRRSAHRRPC